MFFLRFSDSHKKPISSHAFVGIPMGKKVEKVRKPRNSAGLEL